MRAAIVAFIFFLYMYEANKNLFKKRKKNIYEPSITVIATNTFFLECVYFLFLFLSLNVCSISCFFYSS